MLIQLKNDNYTESFTFMSELRTERENEKPKYQLNANTCQEDQIHWTKKISGRICNVTHTYACMSLCSKKCE